MCFVATKDLKFQRSNLIPEVLCFAPTTMKALLKTRNRVVKNHLQKKKRIFLPIRKIKVRKK